MPISIQARLGRVRATYQFIKSQRQHYSAETLCGVGRSAGLRRDAEYFAAQVW
jgi:hypothetical protein